MKKIRRWLREWLGIERLADELYYWTSHADRATRAWERAVQERDAYKERFDYLIKLQADELLLKPTPPIILRKDNP
jgi:hypothetical protein